MKNYNAPLINILIWLYVGLMCYLTIYGFNENADLYLGIAIGLLLSVNIVYIDKEINKKEIIFLLMNIGLLVICSYLLIVFNQLDVR